MTGVQKSFTWSYTGAQQSWTVPAGVTLITITCYGAGGSASALGGKTVATVPVSAGRVIYGYVGGTPSGKSGGWNGGGTGGSNGGDGGGAGATDVRIGGTGLSNRIMVAGGGGGDGNNLYRGGAGGGLSGGNGTGRSGVTTDYGHGGTQSAGGAAGTTSSPHPEAGSFGLGGNNTNGGGGGGGGWYGGGAGDIGGGGGGSGYVMSSGSLPDGGVPFNTSLTAGGAPTTAGSITIAYTQNLSAPSQPTLASPASGQVLDATNGVPFKLTYHSTDGQDCNAYTLRLKTGTGSYSYWNAATSAWSATEVWNTLGTPVADGGTISISVPTSATLQNGNSYNWSANTQESGANLQGTYADDSTFVASDPPAADITSPADGVTITDTNLPPAAWTPLLHPITGAQTKYRVVWESGAYSTEPGSGTSLGDTGEVPSATETADPPEPLPNDTTIRMFVWIEETDGQDSPWSYVTFPLSLAAPAMPALTAAAGTDATSGLPTVALTVTVADQVPWDHTDTTVQLQGSYDGGATWVTVRDAGTGALCTALALDADGAASVVDGEAVSGDTLYRAIATGTDGDGNVITGPWSDTVTVTLDVSQCWLVDPLDLSTALAVDVSGDDTRTRTITQDVTATLGSSMPVISSAVRQAQTGTFTWICPDKATRDALEALLTSGSTLLQRLPAEQDDPGVHVYFRPTGDLTVDRLAQAPIPVRLVKTGWAQRSRPT